MISDEQNRYNGKINETYPYAWRTMSVEHFSELQEDIETLRRNDQLSSAPTFNYYLNDLRFSLPEDFPTARSILIVATFAPLLRVHFQYRGARIPAMMPPNYYISGLTRAMLLDEIRSRIIPKSDCRIDRIDHRFYLKLLAVRSGLARYGRNNICYVEGMGSFITLHAYLTDYSFETDHWNELGMMPLCHQCQVCIRNCPTSAISADRFIIAVDRCIPLYNEIEGEFPDWIPPAAHNSVMGCMTCQSQCPANHKPMQCVEEIEDISEEETRQFINGDPNDNVLKSVSRKLKIPYLVESKDTVGVVCRNIRALVEDPG